MKRIDQEGGRRLIENRVSAKKFNCESLLQVNEFKAISSIEGCKLIDAVSRHTKTFNEAFDVVLTLYRENINGFELLCVNPEWVDDSKVKKIYEIQQNKSKWADACDAYKLGAVLQLIDSLREIDSKLNYDEVRSVGRTDIYNDLD